MDASVGLDGSGGINAIGLTSSSDSALSGVFTRVVGGARWPPRVAAFFVGSGHPSFSRYRGFAATAKGITASGVVSPADEAPDPSSPPARRPLRAENLTLLRAHPEHVTAAVCQ